MQIARAVGADGEGRVTLTLAPEELGQVRLELRHGAEGLLVHIAADRPDTVDLIRRHLDDLGRELRALGHQGIAFSFSGESGSRRHGPHHASGAATAAGPPSLATGPRAAAPGLRLGGIGLDIRL